MKKGRWLARYNPGFHDTTRGLTIDSPAKRETEKTEFTVSGILRDAELKIILTTAIVDISYIS